MSEPKELAFHVVCMDCPRVIKQGDPGAKTSHGLCDECWKRRTLELARDFPLPKEGAA